MAVGMLATKEGMMQFFSDGGESIPVTVLRTGPCMVLQVKTKDSDGYDALQVGFQDARPEKLPKARRGKPYRHLREFRTYEAGAFSVGQILTVAGFQKGDRIDVQGVTKGHGFQGVIKRHGKHGGPGAHGSHFHRTTGSIGMRTWPGRVLKNTRMAGQMGAVNRTIRNLEVVGIDPELHLLFVRGAVPGARKQLVRLVCKTEKMAERFVQSKPEPAADAAKE